MSKLLDRIKRRLTGYTDEERADIQRRYIDWRIETVFVGSLERQIAEDEAEASEDQPQNKQEEGNA